MNHGNNGPRVLLTVPRYKTGRGVANYYRILRPYLDPGKDYFEVGARAGQAGLLDSLRRLMGDYWHFRKRLSENDFHLVHLNPSLVPKSLLRESVFLVIALAHGLKVVVFFRGWDPEFFDLIQRRFSWLFKALFGRVDAFIVLAQEFRSKLIGAGIHAPIFVMTTAVDDGTISNASVTRQKGDLVRILCLSRLESGKGLLESIEAFAHLKRDHSKVALSIAGDGSQRKAAEILVRKLQLTDVTFLGHVQGSEKQKAFLDSDVYLFPTTHGEGMPTSVLEAMAYGLPVVTRPVGGLKDFFIDGEMGYMTESQDPVVFATLLSRVVSDAQLLSRMGAFNRAYAAEHFTASKVAKNLDDIYRLVTGLR